MNKKTLYSLLSFMILLLIFAPQVIILAADAAPAAAAAGGIPQDLKTIVGNFAKNLGTMSAGLSIIAFIVAGIMFLTATGNPSRMTIAKGALIAAVVGIVILALSTTADKFVTGMFT